MRGGVQTHRMAVRDEEHDRRARYHLGWSRGCMPVGPRAHGLAAIEASRGRVRRGRWTETQKETLMRVLVTVDA